MTSQRNEPSTLVPNQQQHATIDLEPHPKSTDATHRAFLEQRVAFAAQRNAFIEQVLEQPVATEVEAILVRWLSDGEAILEQQQETIRLHEQQIDKRKTLREQVLNQLRQAHQNSLEDLDTPR